MKYPIHVLVFPLLVAGSFAGQASVEKLARKRHTVGVKPGLQARPKPSATEASEHYMPRAWYEYGTSQTLPPTTSTNEFVVLADATCKAKDFVSSSEQWLRYRLASRIDTAYLYSTSSWRRLTAQQRRTRMTQEQVACRRQADSVHIANNRRGKYQIWLLNNSADTITLGTQDASLICVLQAQNKEKQWQPVQYWQFSKCGNSYIAQFLLPKERICFLAKPLRHGDFKTKLRYKLAGAKQFYYSNEFKGRINYGEFTEKPSPRPRLVAGKPVSVFKLDSLPRTHYFGHLAFHYQPTRAW